MVAAGLTVAVAEGLEDVERRWIAPIIERWPRPEARPAVSVLGLEDLMEGVCQPPGPVLVIAGAELAPAKVDRLAERLAMMHAPAVLLHPAPTREIREAERLGLLVEPWTIEAAALASELHALAQRQRTVEQLQDEARLTSASARGLAERLRTVHEELELAASLQREILPRGVPTVDGMESGVLFRPSGQVSGDLYDLRTLDDGRVCFFLADAVGHGIPAALLTMLVAQSLHRALSTPGVRPARVLATINEDLCGRGFSTPRFATAVCGVFDPRSGETVVAGAGHPPPLRLAGGAALPIETAGPLLGIFEEAEFDEAALTLGVGETLLVFSDGFESAFPGPRSSTDGRPLPNLAYVDRLRELLSDSQDALDGVMQRLCDLLDRQEGSLHQADDLTAVVLRRTALAVRALAA